MSQSNEASPFPPNEALLQQYYSDHPESQESLVDFGVVPSERQEREDWCAEVVRFLLPLSKRGYIWEPAVTVPIFGLCPLYSVRLDRRDFEGIRPVELSYFLHVVNQLCQPGQRTVLHERVLEIHILGDGQTLSSRISERPHE